MLCTWFQPNRDNISKEKEDSIGEPRQKKQRLESKQVHKDIAHKDTAHVSEDTDSFKKDESSLQRPHGTRQGTKQAFLKTQILISSACTVQPYVHQISRIPFVNLTIKLLPVHT